MPKGAKYGGRSKGTPNKKTVEALGRAERILQLLEDEYFDDDIAELTSAQRMVLYSDMLEYVTPKLSRYDIKADVKHTGKVILQIKRGQRDND